MLKALTHQERVALFGHLPYAPAGLKANPERVIVPWEWSRVHMREVMVPQLAALGIGYHSVTFHYKAIKQFAALWQAWEEEGLLGAIKTWNGSWATRFKRQNGTVEQRLIACKLLGERNLSNHSWGTAFDINAAIYPLGTPMREVSAAYAELVPIAAMYGFAWGGYFSRPDPMHWECIKVLP